MTRRTEALGTFYGGRIVLTWPFKTTTTTQNPDCAKGSVSSARGVCLALGVSPLCAVGGSPGRGLLTSGNTKALGCSVGPGVAVFFRAAWPCPSAAVCSEDTFACGPLALQPLTCNCGPHFVSPSPCLHLPSLTGLSGRLFFPPRGSVNGTTSVQAFR